MKWNTNLVELWNDDIRLRRDGKLRDLLDKGSLELPKGSPYIDQTTLRSTDNFEYNELEVDEMLKVFSNFDRLIENHITIENSKIKLRGYQKDMLDKLHLSSFEIVCHSRQLGMSMMLRLYILRCVCVGKDVVVICNNNFVRVDDIKKFKELLESLPYYMQPALKSRSKNNFIFYKSKVVFTNSTLGHEETTVMIFSDAAFNTKFQLQFEKTVTIRRVSIKKDLQTMVFSGSNIGSYFNKFFLFEKNNPWNTSYSNFNRTILTHNVVTRKENWEDNLRGIIGDKQFLIQYSCCMDEKILNRYDVLRNILNK